MEKILSSLLVVKLKGTKEEVKGNEKVVAPLAMAPSLRPQTLRITFHGCMRPYPARQ